jgi:hypothetical protein
MVWSTFAKAFLHALLFPRILVALPCLCTCGWPACPSYASKQRAVGTMTTKPASYIVIRMAALVLSLPPTAGSKATLRNKEPWEQCRQSLPLIVSHCHTDGSPCPQPTADSRVQKGPCRSKPPHFVPPLIAFPMHLTDETSARDASDFDGAFACQHSKRPASVTT